MDVRERAIDIVSKHIESDIAGLDWNYLGDIFTSDDLATNLIGHLTAAVCALWREDGL